MGGESGLEWFVITHSVDRREQEPERSWSSPGYWHRITSDWISRVDRRSEIESQGADSLFKHTDLSECITGVVMVKIWGGVTVLMRSWGRPEDKEMGLAQVEEGVGYALTRPGLMTFPMW